MRRRALLAAVGATTVSPASAQGTMRQVAVLVSAAENDSEGLARIGGLRQGLKELGWIEGQNVQLDVRYAAGDPQRFRDIAAAFVAASPDLIVINSTPGIDAVHKATRSIPVVMVLSVDPVRLGYIASLARPGGNITGFSFWETELIGKWMQLLKEAVPSIERATIVHNPRNTPFYPQLVKVAEGLSELPKMALGIAAFSDAASIDRVIAAIAQHPNGGVIVPSDPFNLNQRSEIAAAAIAHGLPLISIFPSFAKAGALIAYGPDTTDIYRRSASYVDRILKGARPADLPVQAPTRYDLLVNNATARKLGLALPSNLLASAEEVME